VKGVGSYCEFENIISAGSIQNKVWLNCSDGLYLKEVQDRKIQKAVVKIDSSKIRSTLNWEKNMLFSFTNKGLFEFDGAVFDEINHNGLSIKSGFLVKQSDTVFWIFNEDASFEIEFYDSDNYKTKAYKSLSLNFIKKAESYGDTLILSLSNGSVITTTYQKIKDKRLSQPKVIVKKI